ncbi:hypothetical protein DMA12_31670 [Amycolatopsis balhimycina DSM 5908]|uniref:Acyl-CoA carboxylase subunit epsilon n=1 Tax=Amycolatopsis balhimycina DSM 5908 TaxID=1081091 RepID=A0A428W711_AMYBA|nr:hypothetical protein DMA12_31670 [Amycolatopsis balhimycina DSM 5908]
MVKVVRGEPDPAELAALVLALALCTAAAPAREGGEPAGRAWSDPAWRPGAIPRPRPRPGAWRLSGLPV